MTDEPRTLPLSRRNVLTRIGAGMAGGLAGCSGDGGNGNGNGNGNGDVPTQDLRPVSGAGEVDIPGTVDLIEPLGTDAIVGVQTDKGPVRAMVDGYERLAHGDGLSLGIDLDEIYLFNVAGELLKPRHYEAAETDEVTA